MKFFTLRLYATNEAGEPENTYTLEEDEAPEDLGEYMLTKYDGGRGSFFGWNRIRVIDGLTGENINGQQYYERGGQACNAMLVYEELKSPLWRQMMKSLRSTFADPKSQLITLAMIGAAAVIGFIFVMGG